MQKFVRSKTDTFSESSETRYAGSNPVRDMEVRPCFNLERRVEVCFLYIYSYIESAIYYHECLFPIGFWLKCRLNVSLTHAGSISCSPRTPRFGNHNNTCWGLKITKILIMQFSAATWCSSSVLCSHTPSINVLTFGWMAILNSVRKNNRSPFAKVIYVMDILDSNIPQNRATDFFCGFIQSKKEIAVRTYLKVDPNAFLSCPLFLSYHSKITYILWLI
jgi:hypothetical protein